MGVRPFIPVPTRPARLARWAAVGLAAILTLHAQTTHTWTGANPGEWGYYSNWSTFLVPNTGNDSVVINNTAGAPFTTTIGLSGSPFTVKGISAANASPYGAVVIGAPANPGAQTLNLYNNAGVAPIINVSAGSLQVAAAVAASQGFAKTGAGALLLTGPISGGTITLNGGELNIAGANSSNTLVHKLIPSTAPLAAGATVGSTLRLHGPGALPYPSATLSFDFAGQPLVNNTVTATVDLGGLHRSVKTLSLLNVPRYVYTSSNSTLVIDFQNGELDAKSLSNFDLSSEGSGVNFEVSLPASATIASSSGSFSIGNGSGSSSTKLSTSRVRIGASATFRVTSAFYMGYNGSAGRIEARAPGSILTLSGSTAASRVSSIDVGNSSITPAGYDSGIDMETGTLNLLAGNVTLRGASTAKAPAVAAIRFGAGSVNITNLTLGYYAQYAFDYQCLVVQKGGDAKIQNLGFGAYGNDAATDRRTYRYQLHGGTLAIGTVGALGNSTYKGFVSRGIDWTGGTLKNHPGGPASVSTVISSPVLAPIDLSLLGGGTHPLEVESGQTFTLGTGSRLRSDSTAVTLTKSGAGTLVLAGDSVSFTGLLKLDAGTLALGSANTITSTPLGALSWNAGALAFDLSTIDPSSDRLVLARTLRKGSGPAATRVLDLKSGAGNGTYTLATYASTDLALADFTATGIASDYAADFTVGPSALTVTIAPAFTSGYATWRSVKLSASTNLGDADDLADPDGDGRPNLLEYALGSEPLAADSAAPASVAADLATDRLTLTFNRIADSALTYAVLAADDPSGPWSGPNAEIVFSSSGSSNLAGPVTVSDSVPLSSHPRRFLRLMVSR